ncbi:MAG: YicC family protein [Candidatus Fermentibacteraceae bacterium]|nr:YicC family protein [Candidatus Fermentibacteraceae bacterium]MBN2609527.1 YicC family protein [Candidatus Fermentibacteraceae bacterium]
MKSMTGFGRASGRGAGFMLTVEVRSVNHRNLSLSVSLPDPASEMEPGIVKAVQERFSRGRIRIEARLESVGDDGSGLFLNTDTAWAYLAAADRLRNELGAVGDIPVSVFLGLPGVMERADASNIDREELRSIMASSVESALDQLEESRTREGRDLAGVFHSGLRSVMELATPVIDLQKASVKERFRRLRERVEELTSDIELDRDRLMQELAMMADRSDVSEEVQRLLSHIDHAIETISEQEKPVGRRLDFILQEMHRELNTMGAKVDDSRLAVDVVEMKSILASLKEQAANVE